MCHCSKGAVTALACVVLGLVAAAGPAAASAIPAPGIVRAGAARFEILTPTLIRLEYAADGQFENRPTMLAFNRVIDPPRYSVQTTGGTLVIRTADITLSYELGSGPFSAQNLKLAVAVDRGTVQAFRAGSAGARTGSS
jgi:hypothetical protein